MSDISPKYKGTKTAKSRKLATKALNRRLAQYRLGVF